MTVSGPVPPDTAPSRVSRRHRKKNHRRSRPTRVRLGSLGAEAPSSSEPPGPVRLLLSGASRRGSRPTRVRLRSRRPGVPLPVAAPLVCDSPGPARALRSGKEAMTVPTPVLLDTAPSRVLPWHRKEDGRERRARRMAAPRAARQGLMGTRRLAVRRRETGRRGRGSPLRRAAMLGLRLPGRAALAEQARVRPAPLSPRGTGPRSGQVQAPGLRSRSVVAAPPVVRCRPARWGRGRRPERRRLQGAAQPGGRLRADRGRGWQEDLLPVGRPREAGEVHRPEVRHPGDPHLAGRRPAVAMRAIRRRRRRRRPRGARSSVSAVPCWRSWPSSSPWAAPCW